MHKYLILLASGPDPTHSQLFTQTGHFATPDEMVWLIALVVIAFIAGILRRAFS